MTVKACALLILLVCGVAPAAWAGCAQPEKPPEVHVDLAITQPVINQSLVRQELKQFDISTISPYGPGQQVHVNGLMRGAISVETQSAIAWQHRQNGEDNCFWFDHVTVQLKLNPTIYIAREIPAASCLYKQVLQHEYGHYNTDVKIAQDFQYTLKKELTAFVAQIGVYGPFSAQMADRPKQDLMNRLSQTVKAINDRMKFERMRRQALLDTREEYERVAAACPNERHLM